MKSANATTKLTAGRDRPRWNNASGESWNGAADGERIPAPRDRTVATVQRQALEIIEEVLSGTSPEQAGARARLRIHVASNPGAPVRALLEHLDARRSGGQDWTAPALTTSPRDQ